jgi:hypothetical protein
MEDGANHGITLDGGGKGPQDGEEGYPLTMDIASGIYMATLYAM